MKTGVLLILLAIVVAAGSKYISIRNGLVRERETIDAAWAQVEAALGHRASLVPELVEALGSGAPNPAGAIDGLTDARTALERAHQPRQKIQANAELDNALSRGLLAAESFPKLDGSKKFGDLQDALKEAEYRIAVERRKYNEAVEHYNARTALFPSNLVASLSGFHQIDAYIPTAADAPTPSSITH
jgi:LemA protein